MQFGETDEYCVVAPEGAPKLRFAAAELSRYLGKILGREFLIVPCDLPSDIDAVHVARRSTLNARGGKIFDPASDIRADDGRETYAIEISEESMSFVGNRPRAVLYAVYDFLRENLGCEFSMSARGVEHVPTCPDVTLPASTRRECADFACRGNGFHGEKVRPPEYFARWIDWLAKLRFNRIQLHVCNWEGIAAEIMPEIEKRDMDLDLGVHGLNYFLPAETYYADHSDWYADVENRFGRQIRFSNLGSVEEVSRNILAYLETHPGIAYLGLWPLDGVAFHPADIATGRMGDIVLTYVNKVVERVTAVFPDLRFDHLAYVGYVAPPREARPHHRITTSVCHYWSRNFTRPIYDSWYGRKRFATEASLQKAEQNFHPLRHHRDCCEQLAGWQEIGKTIVFCYYIDLNLSGHNIFDLPLVIQKDLQYYRALGVDGLLNCYCFHEEILWLYRDLHAFADLMWDVDFDWRKRQASLLNAVFADAAPAMERFYDSLNALQNEPLYCGCCLADIFRGLIPAYELSGYLPQLHEATLEQMESRFQTTFGHLDEATAGAADNPAVLERIEGIRFNLIQQQAFARLGFHVLLGFHYGDRSVAGSADKEQELERGLGAVKEALHIFNEWVEIYDRDRPPWVNLDRKVNSYRVALEQDFPSMIRKGLA